jgi:rhodanese-related sulfurtransferase
VEVLLLAPSRLKVVLLEALLVGAAGAALAFAANALSPRGLKLTQNFFPGDTGRNQALPAASTNSAASSQAGGLAARLRAKGLGLVENAQVVEWFHDPRYQQNAIVFLDARNDDEYQEGHIPGAYHFDHFHFDKYLATIIPLCQAAQQIVVYCGGGDCELSEFAATMLGTDLGIPKERIFVYGGGMTEWNSKNLPIETGERKSAR